MSFQNLGNLKMQKEEERQEESHFNTISKPFTTKSPVHVIEAIDALSAFMEIPRNTLINSLISNYLVHAFADFSAGYHSSDSEKTEDASKLLADLSKVIDSSSNISDEAKLYLEHAVTDFIAGNF